MLPTSPWNVFHQAACKAAAAHCKEKGRNISKLAMQYSLLNKDISTILVGMNSIQQVNVFPFPSIFKCL